MIVPLATERPTAAPVEEPGERLRDLASEPGGVAAILLGLTLTGLWIWWALDFGAFFPTVLYPGTVLLLAVLGLLLSSSPLPIARRGPHVVAVGSLLALSLWTLLSILWSPTPDAAPEDAIRTVLYAAAFFAGLWLTISLRSRPSLALAPVVAGGGAVVAVTLLRAMLTNDASTLLSGDGTLDYPLGYRNADAAFFFIIYLTAAAAATRGRTAVPVRCACAAVAAGSLALAVLSQSRGSILAAAFALLVFMITAGDRRRAALSLIASALPVAAAVPILIAPFDAVGASSQLLSDLRHAAVAAMVATASAGLLMWVAALIERRMRPRPPAKLMPRPRTAGLLAGIAVTLLIVAFAAGNPVGWFDDRVSEFREGGVPELQDAQSRFSISASSDRGDYWRVALANLADHPLLGEGAGGFEVRYLEEREGTETPRDAHSAPLEVLGELGIPGMLLLASSLGAALVASLRSRRFGPDAVLISSVAITTLGYWCVHASIDWFWAYPIPTAIVFSLLGSGAGAASMADRNALGRGGRGAAIVAMLVVSLAAAPLYFSERLLVLGVQAGTSGSVADAYRDLETAADLDPWSSTPLLALAQIALRDGEDERALSALERARARQPDDYLNYLTGARILAATNPDRALRLLDRAEALNPLDRAVRELQERLITEGSAADRTGPS